MPNPIILPVNAQLVAVAMQEIFVTEIPGSASNPAIIQYARELGIADYTNDDVAWCKLFNSWVHWKCGMQFNKSLGARDALKCGQPVAESSRMIGDNMIFWRDFPAGTLGHVGLYINTQLISGKAFYRVLGGNQTNQVKISDYAADHLLGVRRAIPF